MTELKKRRTEIMTDAANLQPASGQVAILQDLLDTMNEISKEQDQQLHALEEENEYLRNSLEINTQSLMLHRQAHHQMIIQVRHVLEEAARKINLALTASHEVVSSSRISWADLACDLPRSENHQENLLQHEVPQVD